MCSVPAAEPVVSAFPAMTLPRSSPVLISYLHERSYESTAKLVVSKVIVKRESGVQGVSTPKCAFWNFSGWPVMSKQSPTPLSVKPQYRPSSATAWAVVVGSGVLVVGVGGVDAGVVLDGAGRPLTTSQ